MKYIISITSYDSDSDTMKHFGYIKSLTDSGSFETCLTSSDALQFDDRDRAWSIVFILNKHDEHDREFKIQEYNITK